MEGILSHCILWICYHDYKVNKALSHYLDHMRVYLGCVSITNLPKIPGYHHIRLFQNEENLQVGKWQIHTDALI